MNKWETIAALRVHAEEARKALRKARLVGKDLFSRRIEASFGEIVVTHERWAAQLEVVQRVGAEWQEPVRAYIDALKR